MLEQGVRTIVSTSHRRKGMFETSERVMTEQFQLARQIVKEVALATAVMTGILVVVKTWVHFSPMLNVMILAVIGMLVYGIIVVGFKIIKIEEIKKLLKQS